MKGTYAATVVSDALLELRLLLLLIQLVEAARFGLRMTRYRKLWTRHATIREQITCNRQ